MASAFDTALALRNGSLLDRFGESIAYTPSGGAAATITAVVDRDTVAVEPSDDGTYTVHRMTIHVRTSDVATRTLELDAATIDGASWALDSEGASGAGMVDLVVRRRAVVEKRPPRARQTR